MSILKRPVLLLNSTYEVLGTVTLKRAIQMTFRQVNPVTIEEIYPEVFRSTSGYEMKIPSVIRLNRYVNKYRKPKFRKSKIFARDFNMCLYCAKKFKKSKLTVDHIMPSSRGGTDHPLNLATACLECNQKKGNKTPDEAGMPLRFQPKNLTAQELNLELLKERIKEIPQWRNYLVR